MKVAIVFQVLALAFWSHSAMGAASDWVTMGGDFERSGYKAATLGSNVDSFEVIWRFAAGSTESPKLGVLVYNEKVYLVSSNGTLYVLNARDGNLLTQFDIDNRITKVRIQVIEPVNGILFVASAYRMYAVSVAENDLKVLWTVEKKNADDIVPSAKLGRVFVTTRAASNFLCYDLLTGAAVPDFGSLDSQIVPSKMSLYDGSRLLAVRFNWIFSSDLGQSIAEYNSTGNGNDLWGLESGTISEQTQGPLLVGSFAFLNNASDLVAFDIVKRSVVWSTNDSDSSSDCYASLFMEGPTIASDGQYLYRKCGSSTKKLIQYDIVTGKVVKRMTMSSLDNSLLHPIIVDDYIITDGISLYSKASGNRVAAVMQTDNFAGELAFFDGMIYTASSKNVVYAYRAVYKDLPTTTHSTASDRLAPEIGLFILCMIAKALN